MHYAFSYPDSKKVKLNKKNVDFEEIWGEIQVDFQSVEGVEEVEGVEGVEGAVLS